MQVSHRFTPDSVAFDDDNLISHAGLVPVLTLAERTGLHQLLADKVSLRCTSLASAGANVAPKLATIIAGMCAGADSIDDIVVLRAGGHKTLFTGVYAPATLGQTLREFTFGHARQLDSVLTNHLRALADIIETVFADPINGPLAHIHSGKFGANSAWVVCAAIAHNLLRAAGTLTGAYARVRGATLRRRIVAIPARLARPARTPILHLPTGWPWSEPFTRLWQSVLSVT